jgi:hypothetical protein
MALLKITVVEASFIDGATYHHVYRTEASETAARGLAFKLQGRPTRRGQVERVDIARTPRTSLAHIDNLTR